MLIRRLRRFLSESLESEEWLLDRKNDSYLNIINPQRHIYAEEYDLKKLDDISLNTTFQKPPGLQHNQASMGGAGVATRMGGFPLAGHSLPRNRR